MYPSGGNDDGNSDEEIEQLLNKIQEMFDDPYFREKVKRIIRKNWRSNNKKRKQGISINIRFDRANRKNEDINQFNIPDESLQIETKEPEINTDLIEGENHVFVTVDIPSGYKQEDVELLVYTNNMSITIDHPTKKRLHRYLSLPCEVDPDSFDTTYNNGVLDIRLDKQ
ncbi:MAG: Hsp20/alpha crystallin family protein [Candidatus Thermoplasmatota archaeon]